MVSESPLPDFITQFITHHLFSVLPPYLFLESLSETWKNSWSSVCQVQVNVRRMSLFWEVSLGFCCCFPGIGLVCGAGQAESEQRERAISCLYRLYICFLNIVCSVTVRTQQCLQSFCRHLKLVLISSQQTLAVVPALANPEFIGAGSQKIPH